MIELNYTEEMKKQDKLWETEEEDLEKMEYLYNEIVKEFSKYEQGYVFEIYAMNGECVIDVFESEEEKEIIYNSDDDEIIQFGYCRPLIKYLERILEKKEVY